MEHYAIIKFNSKEEADAFAFAQKDLQVEVVSQEVYNYQHMYEDVELVLSEYMDLSDEDKERVDVGQVVDSLFNYDYSRYNDYIEALINEQLEAQSHA